MDARTNVINLSNEYWVSRCLHAATQFGIADEIDENGTDIVYLANKIKLETRILRSLIRVLCSRGIFRMEGDRIFHTDSSRLLRAENPATVIDMVRWSASPESWRAVERLPATLASGKSGFEAAWGARFFDYMANNEQAREVFGRSMDGYTRKQVACVIEATDLSSYDTIMDVGGGRGLLARAIAGRYPSKKVILFDLPGVAPLPQENDDIQIVCGDFFVDELPPADLVLLMNVLHDWSDDEISNLLTRVRRSLRPGGSVYVSEGLVSPGRPSIDLMDLGMAVMTGGRQRSGEDYRRLLAESGLLVSQEIECSQYMSILVSKSQQAA